MAKREMETTVKISGKVEASMQKALDSVSNDMERLEKAAKSAAGPAGELADKISKQSKELKRAQTEYAGYVLAGEEGSDAARELAARITELSNDLNSNRSALDAAERAAKDLAASYDDAGSGLGDLGDSAAGTKGGFSIMKGAISNLVSGGIQFLIGKVGEAIQWLGSLSEETQEYREDIGKLETAWESAGKSTDLAKETYKDFYSVLGEEDRSVEAVNHLAKFVDTEKDMNRWTDIATGVWGTFGDSLPIEGLTEAANETAKVGKVTGPLADALNWAGINEDKFNEKLAQASSEQERAKLITDTLSKTYSDAAENYRKNNASVIEARNATSELTDAEARLGEKLEPLHTSFTLFKAKALDALAPAIEKIAGLLIKFVDNILPRVISFITETVAPKISWLANIISTVLGGALSLISTVIDKVSGALDALFGKAERSKAVGDAISSGAKAFSKSIPKFAAGGFTSGVSIAGEAGTEAVISFNPAYRSENLGYWAQAGRMLGATVDDAGFSLGGGSTSNVISLGGVNYNPNITVNGNAGYGDIIKALKDHEPEFLDMLEDWLEERGAMMYA